MNTWFVFACFMIRGHTFQTSKNLIINSKRFNATMTVMSSTDKHRDFKLIQYFLRQSSIFLLLAFLMKEIIAWSNCAFFHLRSDLALLLTVLTLLNPGQAILTMNKYFAWLIFSTLYSFDSHFVCAFFVIILLAFSSAAYSSSRFLTLAANFWIGNYYNSRRRRLLMRYVRGSEEGAPLALTARMLIIVLWSLENTRFLVRQVLLLRRDMSLSLSLVALESRILRLLLLLRIIIVCGLRNARRSCMIDIAGGSRIITLRGISNCSLIWGSSWWIHSLRWIWGVRVGIVVRGRLLWLCRIAVLMRHLLLLLSHLLRLLRRQCRWLHHLWALAFFGFFLYRLFVFFLFRICLMNWSFRIFLFVFLYLVF